MNSFLFKKNIKRHIFKARTAILKSKQKAGGTFRILMYHSVEGTPYDHRLAIRVSPDKFALQMHEIPKTSNIVATLSEILIKSGSGGNLALTFDDGFKDNFTNALPLLNQHGFRGTFFPTISLINKSVKKYWKNGIVREYMNWEDVITLSKLGHEVGSHMLDHQDLRRLNQKDLIRQLRGSKEIIEDKIKKPVNIFSYPYGGVSEKVVEVAKIVGYIGGCSSIKGLNFIDTNTFLLRRTEVDGFDTIRDFKQKLLGIYD